jgi:hypothetical protein
MSVDKHYERIKIACRATIEIMKFRQEKYPGVCIISNKLFPQIERRAGKIMDDDYDPMYDDEAIGVPNVKFISRWWREICLMAAGDYQVFIVWDDFIGFRLGTFQEYQQLLPKKLKPQIEGQANGIRKRAKVIVKLHGPTPSIPTISYKLLESGEEIQGE